ncbi:uncharacterized protein LOC124915746 [Impatiens glandulifera]|uniref:uncharacterized protein LOC124915746 n=1 Tax=Impatiens glandulifera TaxID=253017 RepID=UPI001FB10D4B|nr:uncharacterized protein LOC124915746 [Impatiens glandulifera]
MTLIQGEDLELEKQLQILNKPSLKTIISVYGDLYDCVDFYKQPAFDHPLLKNHTFQPQMKPTYEKMRNNSSSSTSGHLFKIFKEGGCPVGTVPIRRTTKADLIRQKQHSSKFGSKEQQAPFIAVVRTNSGGPFSGAGAFVTIHKPKVDGGQYSAVRLRVENDVDAIQIGWRVDPELYGDDQVRLYTYFKAGEISCFNTKCPGFIIVNTDIPLDYVFPNYYEGEGDQDVEISLFLARDLVNGNWWLELGNDDMQIGFWPSSIFTGLQNSATYIDWGGEVSSDNVPMGLGTYALQDSSKTAICRQIRVLTPDANYTSDAVGLTEPYCNFVSDVKNNKGEAYDAFDHGHKIYDHNVFGSNFGGVPFPKKRGYSVLDIGDDGDFYGHCAYYGGPNPTY